MREVLQSSRCPLYLKKQVYIWSYGEMGLKLCQNINFRPFLGFFSVFGCDTVFFVTTKFSCSDTISWSRPSFLVATKFSGCNTISWSRVSFWTATCFSSPTCRGHNFFILTRIWACEYSLERYLNVKCRNERI